MPALIFQSLKKSLADSNISKIIRGNLRICVSFYVHNSHPRSDGLIIKKGRTQIPQIRGLLADNMGRSAPGDARRLHGFLRFHRIHRFHRIPRISRTGAAMHPDGLCVICEICEPISANPDKSHFIQISHENPRICVICVRPFPGM